MIITEPIQLNYEQESIVKLVESGKSVCFIGSAGTGKSYLLRYLIDLLREKYHESLFITSPTGIGAINIGGTTLHNFAGIGIAGDKPWEYLWWKIRRSPKALARWKAAKVLIIDEISLLEGNLFDKLEMIARRIRCSHHPFGGIQLLISGDPFQLPPVVKNGQDFPYYFEAKNWKVCLPYTVILQTVYRQRETELIDLLNELRFGKLSPVGEILLKSLERTPDYPLDGIQPTQLYATNEEAEQVNRKELAHNPNPLKIYQARDEEKQPDKLKELTRNCSGPAKLELKIGAQVMLIINLFDKGLVNGSQGVVIRFEQKGKEELPVVKFTNGRIETIRRFPWVIAEYRGKWRFVLASRNQIPLILSWAITIHKSQGQSIERLKVDCRRIFINGQLYVALSRASSQQYLQVINFHPQKLLVCEKVKDYYRSLVKDQLVSSD